MGHRHEPGDGTAAYLVAHHAGIRNEGCRIADPRLQLTDRLAAGWSKVYNLNVRQGKFFYHLEKAIMKSSTAMSEDVSEPSVTFFPHGTEWAGLIFTYIREPTKNSPTPERVPSSWQYVQQVKEQDIRLVVITNHNKFSHEKFRALRKKTRKEGICFLPGVELSVNDGANGVHTRLVFSGQWIQDGQDYVNQFLSNAFSGKTPAQYE
jgi:hypothetical protein